ncbi:chromate efflux transporter [Thioalkalivibrio thiocyanodenitrificans]|uniref:chromate efflux transporter n=1 Tax=Thioalkalivibrio thiocyanodenitrificans TaxID=243063 RepID=UPI00037F8FF5|nr:chromate efflux transporter [Thioalkalivibrio thiocyanodenitrificans]
MSREAGTRPAATEKPAPVGLLEAVRWWLKLGFISFGGPAGQISIMHQELVERRRWISEHRFLHALNYTMVLPGPEAQQLATYIGWLMHGTLGGIIAGTLFVLPSLFILIGLTWIYLAFGDVPVIQAILYGIKPAVTAIVVHAAWRIGSRALKNGALWAMAAAAFVAIFALNIPFPYIVIGAGIIGWIGGRLSPDRFRTGGGHGPTAKDGYGPALIDDDTPVQPWMRFRWPRVMLFATIGLLLWAGVLGGLLAVYGWDGTLTRMGVFFTQAALVTFGGAYAVLPYVYQGGVETYQWLTAHQMIDGLALGESTPGPLIMIVTFVGFVGGWTHAFLGADQMVIAGALGAVVATFFTFLPSFLFILVGAPAVEATRHELHFTAPLTGITAAVVGVILNLAVFFAWHVLWPQGFEGDFEWFTALLGIAAFIALFRYRVGIIPLLIACAAVGASYRLLLQGA